MSASPLTRLIVRCAAGHQLARVEYRSVTRTIAFARQTIPGGHGTRFSASIPPGADALVYVCPKCGQRGRLALRHLSNLLAAAVTHGPFVVRVGPPTAAAFNARIAAIVPDSEPPVSRQLRRRLAASFQWPRHQPGPRVPPPSATDDLARELESLGHDDDSAGGDLAAELESLVRATD